MKTKDRILSISSVGHCIGCLHRYKKGKRIDFKIGTVSTPYGYVRIFTEGDFSRFTFIHAGLWYERVVDRGYTRLGLIRKAKQFVRELTEKREPAAVEVGPPPGAK